MEAERLEPLTYQWCYKKPGGDWTVWEGRTHATETVSSDEIVSGTQFYCRVQGSEGKALNSDACTVTVRYIEITRQPANVSTKANKAVHLSVEAKGKNLQYQWYYKKKVAYTGTATYYNVWNGFTQPTINPPANNSWDGMTVKCRITDSDGHSVYTDESTITLLPYEDGEFQIATQPKSVSVEKAGLANQPATFSVKVKNGSEYRYQWYYKKKGQTSFNVWKGHTRASESVRPNETWDGIQLYCKLTDADGNTLQSSTATINVLDITQNPESRSILLGKPLTLSVKAVGTGLSYQWYYRKPGQSSFSVWKGRTHATETVPPNATWDGIQLYCVVYGNGRAMSCRSSTAMVSVLSIATQPKNQTVTLGNAVTLSVKATGTGISPRGMTLATSGTTRRKDRLPSTFGTGIPMPAKPSPPTRRGTAFSFTAKCPTARAIRLIPTPRRLPSSSKNAL